MTTLRTALSPFSPTVLVGILGGDALITVVKTADRGQTIYWPYGLLVIALTTVLAFHGHLSRRERFAMFVSGFMIASGLLYLYLILIANPDALHIPVWGHLWRIGFLLGVGAVLGAGASAVTGRPARDRPGPAPADAT